MVQGEENIKLLGAEIATVMRLLLGVMEAEWHRVFSERARGGSKTIECPFPQGGGRKWVVHRTGDAPRIEYVLVDGRITTVCAIFEKGKLNCGIEFVEEVRDALEDLKESVLGWHPLLEERLEPYRKAAAREM